MLTAYWLTFRLHGIDQYGKSTGDRRDAIEAMVKEIVPQSNVQNSMWLEPTSFIAFWSDQRIERIALKLKAIIDEDHDVILIRKTDSPSAIICGHIVNPSVFGMFKKRSGDTYLRDISSKNLIIAAKKRIALSKARKLAEKVRDSK